MNVFTCSRVENCFSKTTVFQYLLRFKIGDQFLNQFESISRVKCYRNFPRPYFTIALPDGTAIKGVLGDVALKVIFPVETAETSKEKFEQLLISIAYQYEKAKE